MSKSTMINSVIIFILIILIPVIVHTSAENRDAGPDYVFFRANSFYEEGRYEEAIREYNRLLAQGLESGNLYFNLGNCYFKKKELGMAILFYERAMKLIPNDSDLESNYNFALSKIKGRVADSVPWFRRLLNIFSYFSLDGLSVFLSIVFILINLVILADMLTHSLRRPIHFILPVLIVIFIAGIFSLYSRASVIGKEAIIIADTAEVKFEPIDNATTFFTVHEGMKVYVIEAKNEWSKVKRSDGKTGWLRSDSFEKI